MLVIAVNLIDGYSTRTDMLSLAYTSQHAIALLAGMLVMLLVTFVFIREQYSLQSSRAVIALSFAALIPLTLTYRRWLTLRVEAVRKRQPVIFVGSEASCMIFKESCENSYLAQEVLYVATDTTDHEACLRGSAWKCTPFRNCPRCWTGSATRLSRSCYMIPAATCRLPFPETHGTAFFRRAHLHAGAFPRSLLAQDSPPASRPAVAVPGRLRHHPRPGFRSIEAAASGIIRDERDAAHDQVFAFDHFTGSVLVTLNPWSKLKKHRKCRQP